MGRLGGDSLERKSDHVDTPPQSFTPALTIDPAELNLGELWEEPEFTAAVSLRNTSDGAVSVKSFGTSCDCSGVEPSTVVVPAQGSVPLRVKMDLTHRLPHLCEMERRPFSVVIHPLVLQAGVAPNGWEFKGVIRSRVGLSATRVEFGDLCTHAGPLVTRKVRATAFDARTTLEAVARTQRAKVSLAPVAGKSGEFDIAITPDPKLPLGLFRFEVAVIAVTPDGTRHVCAGIEVSGEMRPATRIVPGIVLLGEHSLGGEATAEVVVRFPDASGWVVDRVEVGSPDSNLKSIGSSEDGVVRYRLVQKITGGGDQANDVKFFVGKAGSGQEVVETKVRYYGVAVGSR